MFDNAQDTLLFLGIALATIGLIGGAVHYYWNNGRMIMKNYSTIREAAKHEEVPYTVIQGWASRVCSCTTMLSMTMTLAVWHSFGATTIQPSLST